MAIDEEAELEDSEEEEETPPEPKPSSPWVSGPEAFKRYKKPLAWLRLQVKTGALKMRKLNGAEQYSLEDLEKLCGSGAESGQDGAISDLLRAARETVGAAKELTTQAQQHLETMFKAHQSAYEKLLTTQAVHLESQNAHILKLEAQSLETRELAERAMSMEHQRKLDEINQSHKQVMQKMALDKLATTIGPWLMQKMGGGLPGVGRPADAPKESVAVGGANPQIQMIGEVTIQAVATMTDEKFEKLKDFLDPELFDGLSMIRMQIKGAQ